MITLIASVAANRVIGHDGEQPLYLKADLKRFKQLTTGHVVVMGRKTYESILSKLGKPLPNRTSIIVTRQENFTAPSDCLVCNSVKEALEKANSLDENVFVIGGAQLFDQTIALADRLELTEIHADLEGNILFPEVSARDWQEVSREEGVEGANKYAYVTYVRK